MRSVLSPNRIASAWLAGVLVFVLLVIIGSAMNFRTQAVPAPACENEEFVEYIGCEGKNNPSIVYYVTGWPQKTYCYFSGKNSCTPEQDFLDTPRGGDRADTQKENLVLIVLISAVGGLFTTSLLLTTAQVRRSHENTRD